jgi:hypothetical protein
VKMEDQGQAKARRAGLSVAHAHLPRTPSPNGAASSAMVDGGRVVPDAAPLGLFGCGGSSTATEMPVLRAWATPLRASCPIVGAFAPPTARAASGCMTERSAHRWFCSHNAARIRPSVTAKTVDRHGTGGTDGSFAGAQGRLHHAD